MTKVMHQSFISEKMWYNEWVLAEQQYNDANHQTNRQTSRDKVLYSFRMLQFAQRETNRIQTAARKRGESLTYTMICRGLL
jgi:hypothetical protein